MSGLLIGGSYFLVCALIGFICAYFLNVYIVLVLAVIAVILLFLIIRGPHQAEGGVAALFMTGFVSAFIVGMIIGCLPYVPWDDLWNYISSFEIRKFFKDYILH
jgi:hypothetical protein